MINFVIVFLFILITILVFYVLLMQDASSKILLINSLTNVTSLLIVIMGLYKTNVVYFNLAIIYFLLGTITTVAYLKYFTLKSANK